MREAQDAAVAGKGAAALRDAAAAERAAVDALVTAAKELRPAGRVPTATTLDRLRTTLHAVASDDDVRTALDRGRLVEDAAGGSAWGLLDGRRRGGRGADEEVEAGAEASREAEVQGRAVGRRTRGVRARGARGRGARGGRARGARQARGRAARGARGAPVTRARARPRGTCGRPRRASGSRTRSPRPRRRASRPKRRTLSSKRAREAAGEVARHRRARLEEQLD